MMFIVYKHACRLFSFIFGEKNLSSAMIIRNIRAISAPMMSKIANAYIDFSKMTTTVVALKCELNSGREVIGYGFNSNGRYSAKSLMDERFIPRLMEVDDPKDLLDDQNDLLCPFKCWKTMMTNEKPGGHGERSVAVGTLDMAIWDALAKAMNKPLWKVLSERFNDNQFDSFVEVYAAGGYYYPGKSVEMLQNEMKSYLDRGYVNVKMKIGGEPGGQDLESALRLDASRIEGVLKILPQNSKLAVDANGRFDIKSAIRYADLVMSYGNQILWYEEAGDPLDYALQSELSAYINSKGSGLAMATGENLFSATDCRNLLRYGGLNSKVDILQFDCALSYGLVEYLRTLAFMNEHGWSRRQVVPHGGHQMSLQMAAGLQLGGNESYPDVFQPYSGFADQTSVSNGKICVDDSPGIGFENNESLFQVMKSIPI